MFVRLGFRNLELLHARVTKSDELSGGRHNGVARKLEQLFWAVDLNSEQFYRGLHRICQATFVTNS